MQSAPSCKHGMINEEIKSLGDSEKELLVHLIRTLREIRYGFVQITVHDSVVTQIDKTEKLRITRNTTARSGGKESRRG